MADKFKFSSLAQQELEESAEWYEEQSPGLGERFANIIYSAANAISEDPFAYPSKKLNLREFVIDKFPYIIIYKYIEKENAVNILHIFHTSRNPKHKYRKR